MEIESVPESIVVLGVGFVSKKVGRTNGGLGVVDSRIRENKGG